MSRISRSLSASARGAAEYDFKRYWANKQEYDRFSANMTELRRINETIWMEYARRLETNTWQSIQDDLQRELERIGFAAIADLTFNLRRAGPRRRLNAMKAIGSDVAVAIVKHDDGRKLRAVGQGLGVIRHRRFVQARPNLRPGVRHDL